MSSWDIFISHASEDKEAVARPLAALLTAAGARVWLDEAELTLGDSLRGKIDSGLARSRYGVIVLSDRFFAKEWPQRELNALAAKEIDGVKVILPVWHGVDQREVARFSPLLADRLAVSTDKGLNFVATEVVTVLRSTVSLQRSAPSQPIPQKRRGTGTLTSPSRHQLAILAVLVVLAVMLTWSLSKSGSAESANTAPLTPAATDPPLSSGIKAQHADEAQSAPQQQEPTAQANAIHPRAPPTYPGIAALMSDGRPHPFVVGSNLAVVDTSSGRLCLVTEGDVLQVQTAPAPDAVQMNAFVLVSKGGNECAQGSTVNVGLVDLEDMQKRMQELIDQDLSR